MKEKDDSGRCKSSVGADGNTYIDAESQYHVMPSVRRKMTTLKEWHAYRESDKRPSKKHGKEENKEGELYMYWLSEKIGVSRLKSCRHEV